MFFYFYYIFFDSSSGEEDPVKAESAVIFREKYLKAFNDPDYQQACKDFIAKYG